MIFIFLSKQVLLNIKWYDISQSNNNTLNRPTKAGKGSGLSHIQNTGR